MDRKQFIFNHDYAIWSFASFWFRSQWVFHREKPRFARLNVTWYRRTPRCVAVRPVGEVGTGRWFLAVENTVEYDMGQQKDFEIVFVWPPHSDLRTSSSKRDGHSDQWRCQDGLSLHQKSDRIGRWSNPRAFPGRNSPGSDPPSLMRIKPANGLLSRRGPCSVSWTNESQFVAGSALQQRLWLRCTGASLITTWCWGSQFSRASWCSGSGCLKWFGASEGARLERGQNHSKPPRNEWSKLSPRNEAQTCLLFFVSFYNDIYWHRFTINVLRA